MESDKDKGVVFNVQRFSLQDGPGIRTTVFLKGCPLTCQWCSNPESQIGTPQLALFKTKCDRCGNCVYTCPEHAICFDNRGSVSLNRKHCTLCGECAQICFPKALILYGEQMTVGELLEVVVRDKIFYQSSGGGITVSGGEPLMQPLFVSNLFEACHREGISTCLDTCGYASHEVVEHVLPLSDVVLFDLKHMDPRTHRRLTGKSNNPILANAKLAAKLAAKSNTLLVFRLPLVPGINDSLENLRQTAGFIRSLDGYVADLDILPYHRLGMGKYEALGRRYSLKKVQSLKPERLAWVKSIFQGIGVDSHIEV